MRLRLNQPELRAAHRLDSGTSGCLVLAKTPTARMGLAALFRQQAVQKIYRALIRGVPREQHWFIKQPVQGKSALSEVSTLETGPEASHVQVNIMTGRTHQIRRHLLACGHPLIGESYYAPHRKVSAKEQLFSRPMLHAFQLIFCHPRTGQKIKCTAPLPPDFRRALACFHLKII